MRIRNHTSFDTRSLRSIFCAALRADEKMDGRLASWQHKGLLIEVIRIKYHERMPSRVSGLASVGGTWMRLRLGDNPSLQDVVWVFLHELAHIRGEHHRTMSDTVLRSFADTVLAANPTLALRIKAERLRPPKPPIQTVRYEKAKAMLDFYDGKIRHMDKLAAKWRCKVRYYERLQQRAAAAPAATTAASTESSEEPSTPS